MLLSNKVKQRWNSNNKSRYIKLGYEYTNMKDQFDVDVFDLPNSSNVDVDIICDYCGMKYAKPWYRYIRENTNATIHTDCCIQCRKNKIVDSVQSKYGVKSVLSLTEIQDKIRETNIRRYGFDNPFASELVKNKIAESNIMKYGFKSPMQSDVVKQRAKETCINKYGIPYYVMNYIGYGEQSPRWKGGVAHHRMERSTYEYIQWRKYVFSRDNYTCQCCNAHSGNGKTILLNAHHIENWKDNPQMRYDVENGITLCSNCHLQFHSVYGKSNNTKLQLSEFLNKHGKKIC